MSRKNDHENSYDDDLMKPCFQINPNVELKEIPTTGEEYLLKVIKERQNYKEISTCNIDTSKYAKYQTYFIEEEPVIPVSEKLKPTIEWQNMQIADFSEIRLLVSRIKKTKPKIQYPKRELTTLKHWRSFFKTEPTLTIVVSLHSAKVDAGLEMITTMLNEVPHGKSIDYNLALWVYSLLACVTHPFLSETRCVVRALGKKCREVRSHLNPDDDNVAEAVAPLNLFVCLLSRYFENEDLADR